MLRIAWKVTSVGRSWTIGGMAGCHEHAKAPHCNLHSERIMSTNISIETARFVLYNYTCKTLTCHYPASMDEFKAQHTQYRAQNQLESRLPIFITPKTPHHAALLRSRNAQHYFFLPLPLPLVAEPLVATLLARDGVADAGEALPLTVSSCLFCCRISTCDC